MMSKQWAEDESLPMVQYKNYQRIVPASVVKDVFGWQDT